jgi:hypothetical protein
MKLLTALEAIKKTNGCKFATLTYRSKESGELARHQILLGASLENAYKSDLETLKAYSPKGEVETIALAEMIASVEQSLSKGLGNNDAYTQKGVWENVVPNIRADESAERIQVLGMTIGKTILEAGTFKEVKSSAKTLAKKAIEKKLDLRKGKIRAFSVELAHLSRVAANGETVEIE